MATRPTTTFLRYFAGLLAGTFVGALATSLSIVASDMIFYRRHDLGSLDLTLGLEFTGAMWAAGLVFVGTPAWLALWLAGAGGRIAATVLGLVLTAVAMAVFWFSLVREPSTTFILAGGAPTGGLVGYVVWSVAYGSAGPEARSGLAALAGPPPWL